jgi:hypothetical protein
MNDFKECLAFSHAGTDLPFWSECYHAAFPTMVAMHDHRQNGDHQKQGIDRSIILENGKILYIDEKLRGRNRITGRIYDDILLEEWSNKERQSPGWVVKPLLCDYIAYAIAPIGKCYLLPVIQLQSAWLQHGETWKGIARFPREARNNGWITVNWPVSVQELFKAIGSCLRVQFDPFDFTE